MMERLEARGEALGERAAERAVARLADAVDVAGIAVTAEPGRVVVSGAGLRRRMLREPELRWLGGFLR